MAVLFALGVDFWTCSVHECSSGLTSLPALRHCSWGIPFPSCNLLRGRCITESDSLSTAERRPLSYDPPRSANTNQRIFKGLLTSSNALSPRTTQADISHDAAIRDNVSASRSQSRQASFVRHFCSEHARPYPACCFRVHPLRWGGQVATESRFFKHWCIR